MNQNKDKYISEGMECEGCNYYGINKINGLSVKSYIIKWCFKYNQPPYEEYIEGKGLVDLKTPQCVDDNYEY